jgi:hypothetical protein
MATPGQLVQAVSEVLGIPAETVTNYDRVLSESGLRSKGGRGRGAAKVTARDAANLLIAIMGSPIAGASVKEAANTCDLYGPLPVLGHVLGMNTFANLGLPTLDELPNKHTLRDGISALINSATRGEHYRIPGAPAETSASHRDGLCRITLIGRHPWAEIYADGVASGEGKNFARRVYTRRWKRGQAREEKDLHQERIISYRTIRVLGSLLSEPMP